MAAGANPNVRSIDEEHGETPLHWAASSDDVDVAWALIERGRISRHRKGQSGTPLDNAIGYGCWHVARLLAARGARVDKLWHAAALGMLDRLEDLMPAGNRSRADHEGWQRVLGGPAPRCGALVSAGADLNWVPDYAEGTPLDAAAEPGTRRQNVIDWLRSRGAGSATTSA